MDQLSESLQGSPCDAEKIYEMTGFDVSSEQFPLIEERRSGQDYFVHDMTKQFPRRFHGEFDVVHIRFMTCALRRQDIAAAVENVTELLRQCPFNDDLYTRFHLPKQHEDAYFSS